MGLDEKLPARLDQLIEAGNNLSASSYRVYRGDFEYEKYGGDLLVERQDSARWGATCLTALTHLEKVGGDYLQLFQDAHGQLPRISAVQTVIGVLQGAKDDYEQGMLFDARSLIAAEVFDDFLGQADHLLEAGYYQPAAVVAGAVLEDGLRKLCDRNSIGLPPNAKAEYMNAELARAKVYNVLAQKQITALTDLRNKAAHGQWDQFTEADVKTMLPQVRDFMARHFS